MDVLPLYRHPVNYPSVICWYVMLLQTNYTVSYSDKFNIPQ